MAMSTRISRNAIIVILAALLIGGLSSAAWTFQSPQAPRGGRSSRPSPSTPEDRRKMLERIQRQMQQAGPASQSPRPTVEPSQTVEPAPAPPPVPAATPIPTPTPFQAQPAASTPPPAASAPQQGKVKLNFENADLYDFVNQITTMLGLTPVIVDPEVKGTVNLLTTEALSKDDVLPLFSLILKNNNAALVRQGSVYQIIPISSALKRGVEIIEHIPGTTGTKTTGSGTTPAQAPQFPAKTPIISTPVGAPSGMPGAGGAAVSPGALASFKAMAAQEAAKKGVPLAPPPASTAKESDNPKASRITTNIIRVEFVPVKDLIEPIKLFMTDGGTITPYERLNMLILTDYSDSISRIMQLVQMLDSNFLDPDLVELVKVDNNASGDIVDDLKKLYGSGAKDSATGVSFISMDRINAIFVMASSKRALEEVKGWIKELDSSSAKNIQTYVYIVENSTASNIAMMLSALYGGEGSTSGNTGTGGTGNTGTGLFGNSRNNQGSMGSGTNLSTSGTSTAAYGSQSNYQSGPFGAGSSGGGYGNYGSGGGVFGAGRQLGPQLNNQRTITSQVLRGGQLSGLKDTVRMVVDDVNNSLIIQATSVDYAYISDTIKKMDVMPRQALIDARIFEVDLSDNLSFGVSAALQAKGPTNLTTGELSSSGLLTATTFVPIGSAREIMASIEALRLKTKVRILEAPSVLALDGQQAQITVGSEIPYPGTSYTPSSGGSTTSVEYRDTGITLIVVPRISASGSVTLDLVQEISAPGAATSIGETSAPSFSKTSVSTTLAVKDGETVAIAGLIRDTADSSRSGIPFLSQIPILGALFGQTTKNSSRTELIILITPHVIKTPEKLRDMTQDLKDSLRHVRKMEQEKED